MESASILDLHGILRVQGKRLRQDDVDEGCEKARNNRTNTQIAIWHAVLPACRTTARCGKFLACIDKYHRTTEDIMAKKTVKAAKKAAPKAPAKKAVAKKAAPKAAKATKVAKAVKAAPAAPKAIKVTAVAGKAITASALLNVIAEHIGVSRAEAKRFVESYTDILKAHVLKGVKVKIGDIGMLLVRARKARMGRNPQTGEPVKIKASKKLAFRQSATMRDVMKK
jgi:nucleoid DNA-binding protein